jgi:CHAT domain-containing protein
MRTAATRSLRRSAAELSRLLGSALPDDDRTVVISPGSELLALPWPLLPPLQRRPVCVTRSLSDWHRGRAALVGARSEPSTPWSVTAAAGPGLPRARQETAAVAEAWAGCADTYDRPTATPAEVLEAMSTSRLVHVAAHGVHQVQNPMFSSLSLSGGPLFAYDVDRRGRVPEHVVLSACDVGRSTVRAGQETLGLTSVLLQLGCVTVVAGVARVHDDTAAEIMQRYHAELVAGRDAAEALCWAADRVDAPSPFVCFGAAWRPSA